MIILGLQAENFKAIKVLNMQFAGNNLVQITGKNGAGKSSTLDAIVAALAGKKVLDSEPLRKGQNKGWVRLDLGNGDEVKIIVERSITEKGMYLTLKGEYPGTAQDFLDKLVSGLTFDPMAFAKMDITKQTEILLDYAGVKDILDAKKQRIKQLKEERRDNDRDLKAEETRLQPYVDLLTNKEIPDKEIDTMALMGDLTARERQVSDYTREAEKMQGMILKIADTRKLLNTLLEQFQQAEAELQKINIDGLHKDIEGLKSHFQNADALNKKIRDKQAVIARNQIINDLKSKSSAFTDNIGKTETEIEILLKEINLCIDGLEISDEHGLTYKGLPYLQLSTSEKLKIAAAIGMYLNPELKTLIIRDGNDLDDDGVKKILQFAESRGYQVIIERIYKADNAGIVFEIEAGEIK